MTRRKADTLELKVPEHVFKRFIAKTLCRSHHPIALGVATDVPIFAAEHVMDEVGS